MNLFTKQKQTHRLRQGTYGYQGGRGVGRDRLKKKIISIPPQKRFSRNSTASSGVSPTAE